MPLRCCVCSMEFAVNYSSRQEALEFQNFLNNHYSNKHPGMPPDYELVDSKGVLCDLSPDPVVKEEERLMSLVSALCN